MQMNNTFEISQDREFLRHFLTRWRTLSLSPEMVEKLKADKKTNPYAAYGYGRWLSLVNPGGDSLKEAEILLIWAGGQGVQDANAALAELYYDGRTEAGKALPEMHAFLMDSSYKLGSELAQFETLLNTIYGIYGYPEDPALVADILQKHLQKNPGSDPIYYTLLGQALEQADPDAAEKAFRTALEQGETEGYFLLADFYRTTGREDKACQVAEEGVRQGAVNCRRFKAGMEQDVFEKRSSKEQVALHQEIAAGLDDAIAHHDRNACFLKAALYYDGLLGFPKDAVAAMEPLERGCEMGLGNCFWLKTYIHHYNADELPPEKRIGPEELAQCALQAVRLGSGDDPALELVAKAYVKGLLPQHAEEIEKRWLQKYRDVNPEEEDGKDSTGAIAIYPQGFYYAMDLAEDSDLDFHCDIVHFSPLLTRLTKALGYDQEGCHIAMLVEKDGYALDLPDNMTGTLVYGQGAEIRGTVIFLLEEDKGYRLKPFKGLQHTWLFLQLLTAATDGLIRRPTEAELQSIEAEREEEEKKGWEKLVIDVDYIPSDPGTRNHFTERTSYAKADLVAGQILSYEDPGGLFKAIFLKQADDAGVTLVYRDQEYVLTPDHPSKQLDEAGRNYTNFYLTVLLQRE